MWIHKTPLQSSELWDQITPTRLKNHPKYQGGNLTSQIEIPEDPPEGEEEDHHRTPQDHLRVVGEAAAGGVEEAAAEAVGEVVVEHSHCPDTPLLPKQRSF